MDSPVAGVLNLAALAVGIFALICVVPLLGWTLIGPAKNYLPWPAAALFALIFPLVFWVIATTGGRSQRAGENLELVGLRHPRRRPIRGSLPLQYLPRWAVVVVIAVSILCWLSGMEVFANHQLPGQPSYDAATHTYSANDHGSTIRLTKAQYDNAVRAQDRLFLSIELAFVTIAVGGACDEILRRRRSPYVRRFGFT